MSEPTDLRWRFKVIDVPTPMKDGTHYRYAFLGCGISLGAMWEFSMVQTFGQERGSMIVFALVFLLLVVQAFHLRSEHKRIQKLTAEMREIMERHGIPELKDDETGDSSHEG